MDSSKNPSDVLPFIPIAKPSFGDEEVEAVRAVLESGWLTQGPRVGEFEKAFAELHGVKHALATTSCTTALHLALVAVGVGRGDEVIVPAFTWVASANVVVQCGATPVFVDIEPDTYNMDPAAVEKAVSPKTKAIIPVHLFGLAADMNPIRGALPEGVSIVEDAACAAGAGYHNQKAGALGDFGCFSLHPRKQITCGEGGVLTTDNADLAARAEILRNHGASIPEEVRHRGPRPYELPEFNVFGFNYRMTDIQAAVATVQLARLEGFLAERRALADRYDELLTEIPWITAPARPSGFDHAFQAYVALVDETSSPCSRNDVLEKLQAAGIGGRPGTHSVVDLGIYREHFGTRAEDFPVTTRVASESIALPLHNHMSMSDVDRVVDSLKRM